MDLQATSPKAKCSAQDGILVGQNIATVIGKYEDCIKASQNPQYDNIEAYNKMYVV